MPINIIHIKSVPDLQINFVPLNDRLAIKVLLHITSKDYLNYTSPLINYVVFWQMDQFTIYYKITMN